MKELMVSNRTRRGKIKLWSVVVGFLFCAVIGVVVTTSSFAASNDTIMKKWVFTQYYECIVSNQNRTRINTERSNDAVAEDVFNDDGLRNMALPSYGFMQRYSGGEGANCYELLVGTDRFSPGVLGYAGIDPNTTWSRANQARELLTKLGYSEENSGMSRFIIVGKRKTCTTRNDGYTTCDEREVSSGEIGFLNGGYIVEDSFGDGIKIIIDNNRMFIVPSDSGNCETNIFSSITQQATIEERCGAMVSLSGNLSQDILRIKNQLVNKQWRITADGNNTRNYTYTFDDNVVDIGGVAYVYERGNYDRIRLATIIRDLSGMGPQELALTNNEKYQLYHYYLDKALPSEIPNRLTREPSNKNGLVEVRLKDPDGGFSTYYANFNGRDLNSIKVYTSNMISNHATRPEIEQITMANVIRWLNGVDTSTLTDIDATEDSAQASEKEDPCYNAAEQSGWIICDIAGKIAGGLGTLYDEVVEPFLEVNPNLLGGDTEGAWGIMVNIANTIMGIFLLVIIFSQLTGTGIDNYGIKKALPKVIIAAILINLSLLICRLAVDISNILGDGLNDMFSGFASSISSDNGAGTVIEEAVRTSTGQDAITQTEWFKGLLSAGAGGLVAVGGISIGTAFLSGTLLSSLVLPILLLLLVALFAVLFFFIILGVRKAGVIILAVLAPIAFACYMLPNMKKYFDKWLNAFKGLLMVYPICGLLLGGGYFVSRLILTASGNDYMLAFTGCIVIVAPYFLVPSLLKGSLKAMGNVGARISGFGKKFGDKASGKFDKSAKNSKWFQEREKYSQEKAALSRAQRIDKRLGSKDPDSLSRRQKRKLYGARTTIVADKETAQRVGNMAGTGYEAAEKALQKKADAEAIANEMVLIKSDTNDGANEEKLQSIFDEAVAAKDWNRARAAMRIAGRRNDTAKNFANKTILAAGKSYSSKALGNIAKEISEGETSQNWRSGSPLAFEYASDLNKGTALGADGKSAAKNYRDWESNLDNIHNALEHHVTTSGQLMGVQGSNLSHLADLVHDKKMNDYDSQRISGLAQEAIRTNKQNGTQLDSTKAFDTYRLAYGDDKFLNKMKEDGVAINPEQLRKYSERYGPSRAGGASGGSAPSGASGGASGNGVSNNTLSRQDGNWIQGGAGEVNINTREGGDPRKSQILINDLEAEFKKAAQDFRREAEASQNKRQKG